MFVSMAMSVVKSTIRQKLKFEIDDLKPTQSISNVRVPIIFHVGKRDALVRPFRVRNYYDKYNGNPKKLFIDSDCEHGDERPPTFYDECFKFVDGCFLAEHFEGVKSIHG